MLSELKPRLNPVINFFAKPVSKIHPNILSLLGIIPPVLFLLFMISGQYVWALISFFGVFLDTLDGAVARMTGTGSAFGGLLDSTLDRITDSVFIFAFAFSGLVSYPLAFTFLVLSFTISYIRSRAELAGKATFVLNIGIIERPERLIALFIALLWQIIAPQFIIAGMNLVSIVFVIISILSLITVIQRFARSAKLLK